MTIEALPFEHRPRNSIANNLDKINELIDWVNLDTHLYASASGERVTVDDTSSLKGLMVDGRSIQDGTPTPDAPVPVQVVEGPLSLVIGDASVAIDLQGNALASLPDGTRDELHVDSAGRVTVEKHVAFLDSTTGETWTSTGQINSAGLSVMQADVEMRDGVRQETVSRYTFSNIGIQDTNFANTVVEGFGANSSASSRRVYWRYDPGETAPSVTNGIGRMAELGANLYYPLLNTVTIDLGYITPPAIPSGSTVTISASLTPEFTLEWWVDDGITALIDDLIAYIDYKTEG